MEVSYIEWKGKSYPCVEVDMSDVVDCESETTTVADEGLWDAIKEDFEEGDADAVRIDEEIWFYADSDMFKDGVTYKDMVKHLKEYIE